MLVGDYVSDMIPAVLAEGISPDCIKSYSKVLSSDFPAAEDLEQMQPSILLILIPRSARTETQNRCGHDLAARTRRRLQ